jgi:hypothetical protein
MTSIAQARALGIDPALDYSKPWSMSLSGAFDLVFDCNGTLSPKGSKHLLNRDGMVLDIVPTLEGSFSDPSPPLGTRFHRRYKGRELAGSD